MAELRVGSSYLMDMEFLVVVKASLPDRVKARADPATITVVVTPPTGTPVTYSYPADIERSSLGVYSLEIPQTEAGQWRADVTSTGASAAVDQHKWRCFP